MQIEGTLPRHRPYVAYQRPEKLSEEVSAAPFVSGGSLWPVLLQKPRLSLRDVATVVIALLAATAVRLSLDPILENRAPHGFYIVATMYIAWSRGLWPALLTVAAGMMVANYLFVPPRYSFAEEGIEQHISTGLSLFLGVSAAVLSESLRATARENARLYRLAREAAVRREEFIAMASHELRNPLAPIRNALSILQEPGLGPAESVEAREMIERQLRHLTRLVDDLLDVSRLSRGVIELREQQLELRPIVEAAREIAEPLVHAKQQSLSVELPDEPIYLYGDPTRLTQVLANLLNNAAKYTGSGGRIWLRAAAEGDQVVVRVRDTGIGLAPESLTRIFDAFEQVDTSVHTSHGGLGIGLALVRKLVQLHGGSVSASSPGRGQGSEFVVVLPRLTKMLQLPRPQEKLPPVRPVSSASAQRRILVVDDNQANARSLGMLLKLRKHEVQVCHDGPTALDAARGFRPDAVLADLGMPHMSGLELARKLRALPGLEHVLLIAITGFGQPADRSESQAAGFDWHLIKPVDAAELDRILQATSEPRGRGD